MNGPGWFGMVCWNGLSAEQQKRLIEVGNLPIDYRKDCNGWCRNGATVAVETQHDQAPGPRMYCRECAVRFLIVG